MILIRALVSTSYKIRNFGNLITVPVGSTCQNRNGMCRVLKIVKNARSDYQERGRAVKTSQSPHICLTLAASTCSGQGRGVWDFSSSLNPYLSAKGHSSSTPGASRVDILREGS